MFNLAGKYASDLAGTIGRRPIPSALAGAALAGGLATAGNLVTGEAGREDQGRLVAEALGAGALGAIGGYKMPGLRAELFGSKKAIARELAKKGAGQMATGGGMQIGSAPEREQLRQAARAGINAMNIGAVTGAGLGYLGSGALGGMAGGGISNLAQMAGVPGFDQNVITDPEMVGSSNTQMARTYTPTLKYIS
jgi:hypothetical protein